MPAPFRIRTRDELDQALRASATRPLVLLKHSTRCWVSARAHQEFERFAGRVPAERADCAVVFVVEDRATSDEVTARLGVRHESPQAIVVSGGKAVWNDSHDGVEEERLLAAVDALRSGVTPG